MAGDFEGNPFADPEGINPFADPSVTQVTDPQRSVGDDYNPFAEDNKPQGAAEPPRIPPPPTKAEVQRKEKQPKKEKKKKERPSATNQWPPPSDPTSPAVLPSEEDKPPKYTPAPPAFVDPRGEEIRRREEEMARREQALRDREDNIQRLGPIVRENNFPPFPSWCPTPFKPCFYINIKVEVTPSEQWKVWSLLGLMLATWILLIINLLVSIYGAAVAPDNERGDYLTTMGVSILYLVVCVPGTLFCWFMPIYHAYKRDSSLAFMWFFFVMLFQILGYLLNSIGAPRLGACGFYNGSLLFNGNEGSKNAGGAMFLIVGFLWFMGVPVGSILVFFVHKYYRQSGQSLNRAVEEGVSGAAKNQYVRGAVTSGVSAGVKASVPQ